MIKGNGVVAHLVVSDGAVIVPLSSAVLDLLQYIKTFPVISVADIIYRRTQILLILGFALLLSSEALTFKAMPAEAPEIITEALSSETLPSLSLSLALVHNHVIGLLHFLELFLILFLVGVSHISIGVILSAEAAICFFYLIFGSVIAYSENLIWIHRL